MTTAKNNREKRLYIRVTATEYKKIHNGFSTSTKRKFSDYIRFVLLEKPITIYTRNKSTDDFVTAIIALKNELNAIGNNFNQAVKKLHTIKDNFEVKTWAEMNEKSKQLFFKKLDEINVKISKISDQWLQE